MPNEVKEFSIAVTADMQPRAVVAGDDLLIIFDLGSLLQREIRYSEILLMTDEIPQFSASETFRRSGSSIRHVFSENLSRTPPELQQMAFKLEMGDDSVLLFSVDKQHIFSALSRKVRTEQYLKTPDTSVKFALYQYEELLDGAAAFDYVSDRGARYLSLQHGGKQLQLDYARLKVRPKGDALVLNKQYLLRFSSETARNYFVAHVQAKQVVIHEYFKEMEEVGEETEIYGSALKAAGQQQNERKFQHLLAELDKDRDIMQSKVQKSNLAFTTTQSSLNRPKQTKPTNFLIETANLQAEGERRRADAREMVDFVVEEADCSYSEPSAGYQQAEEYTPLTPAESSNSLAHRQTDSVQQNENGIELVTRTIATLKELENTGIDPVLLKPCLEEINRILTAPEGYHDQRDFDQLFPPQDIPRAHKITEALTINVRREKQGRKEQRQPVENVSFMSSESYVSDWRRAYDVDQIISSFLDESETKSHDENSRSLDFEAGPPDVNIVEPGSREQSNAKANISATNPLKITEINVLIYSEKQKQPFERGKLRYGWINTDIEVQTYQNQTTRFAAASVETCTNFKPFEKLLEKGERASREKRAVHPDKEFEDIDGSVYTQLLKASCRDGSVLVCASEVDASQLLYFVQQLADV